MKNPCLSNTFATLGPCVLILFALLSCDSTKSNDYIKRSYEAEYVYDPVTDTCFLHHYHTLARVPCDKLKEAGLSFDKIDQFATQKCIENRKEITTQKYNDAGAL